MVGADVDTVTSKLDLAKNKMIFVRINVNIKESTNTITNKHIRDNIGLEQTLLGLFIHNVCLQYGILVSDLSVYAHLWSLVLITV